MTTFECPNCRKTYNVPSYYTDFSCNCNDFPVAGSIVAQEDVPLIGKWDDYTGSSSDPTIPSSVPQEGIVNTLQGTRADLVYHMRLDNLTARGNNRSTTRTRNKLTDIKLK